LELRDSEEEEKRNKSPERKRKKKRITKDKARDKKTTLRVHGIEIHMQSEK